MLIVLDGLKKEEREDRKLSGYARGVCEKSGGGAAW